MGRQEIHEVSITAFGALGDGIAEYHGDQVFVPGAMPGDRVAVAFGDKRRNGIDAELISVLTESSDRREPACKHFQACGGCHLQYIGDTAYQRWLKDRAVMALAHHGFAADLVLDPVITPGASRRRVALKALRTASAVVLGFNRTKSHQIVDLEMCSVTRKEIVSLFEPLRKLLFDVLPPRMSATVHLTLTSSGLDVLVEAAKELALQDREILVEFCEQYDIAAFHWQDQGFLDPVAIRREPVMNLSGVRVPLPPASFIQASDEGEAALIGAVTAACEGFGRVADLFSGIGTFTFPLATAHQVLAVEGAKKALDGLIAGVNRATGLKQIVARHRDLFRRPLTAKELSPFDAVVFDPPRAGAKEQVAELAQSTVRRVVAVSCNPNTFSRDARTLADGGFRLESVLPVDQFLWSSHLELVGVFTRPID